MKPIAVETDQRYGLVELTEEKIEEIAIFSIDLLQDCIDIVRKSSDQEKVTVYFITGKNLKTLGFYPDVPSPAPEPRKLIMIAPRVRVSDEPSSPPVSFGKIKEVCIANGLYIGDPEPRSPSGKMECRRHAPSGIGWPKVSPMASCGEFEPDDPEEDGEPMCWKCIYSAEVEE